MGECGCVLNDYKYRLLGPDKTLYIITLSRFCENCDAPSGITIEQIDKRHTLFWNYQNGEFNCEPLILEEWPDSRGVAIVSGMTRGEFVKAVSEHLVGVNTNEIGDEYAKLDECAAEIIAEEMYHDSQTQPRLVVSKAAD